MMLSYKLQRVSFLLAVAIAVVLGLPATSEAAFVDPDGWSVGSTYSTYQQWDKFSSLSGATPDVGVARNPTAGLAMPTVSVSKPGALAGSGNYYAFGGDYEFQADIANHTTATGTDLGTHVIVQTAATRGSHGESVLPFSLKIRDENGDFISGGDNTAKLRHDVISLHEVPSPYGTVTVKEEIWEFYLPNFIGDFRVEAVMQVHGSLRELRIDSMVADSAYAISNVSSVPEPSALALCLMGGVGMLVRRRRNAA